ncbi:hypothetical protein J6590_089028 [Homalodisca vitripennis]|nr:hypothetical protein J6590_089028 [Homalodisca vitripennis]
MTIVSKGISCSFKCLAVTIKDRYIINSGVAQQTGLDLTELVNKTGIRSGVIPPKGLEAVQAAR